MGLGLYGGAAAGYYGTPYTNYGLSSARYGMGYAYARPWSNWYGGMGGWGGYPYGGVGYWL